MSKIVVIEGTDCSGKTTQYEMALKALQPYGIKTDSFPNYDSPGCFFVREYLKGAYGKHAMDIDPKTASVFFAMDRYESFHSKEWGKSYREDNNANILFSRYISSNVIHQASKYNSWKEQKEFIDWLYDFETNILKIPRETEVILLDMPPEKAQELKQKRLEETGGLASSGMKTDIHEDDTEYLKRTYETSLRISDYLGWTRIKCVDSNGNLQSKVGIHSAIMTLLGAIFDFGDSHINTINNTIENSILNGVNGNSAYAHQDVVNYGASAQNMSQIGAQTALFDNMQTNLQEDIQKRINDYGACLKHIYDKRREGR